MRWCLTEEQKQQIVEAMMQLVQGDDHPIAIRAARLLISMEEQNIKYSEPVEDQNNRFKAIWERLQQENRDG